MEAAVLYEPNAPLRIDEFELPELGPQHVRVRLVASGVCHSDQPPVLASGRDAALVM